jgi:hypothetical protein
MGFNPLSMLNPVAAIGTATQLFDGYQNRKSQEKANNQNIALSREQMAFQERMSSSAHQRAMTDMKSAGLNPILAARSPASSPSGSSAQVQALPPLGIGSAISSGVATAVQLNQAKENVKLTQAQTDKLNVETVLKGKDVPIAEGKTQFYQWAMEKLNSLFNHSAKESSSNKTDSLGEDFYKRPGKLKTQEDLKKLLNNKNKKQSGASGGY